MNFVQDINEKKYEEFVSNHKMAHFMQSYYWGEVAKSKNFTPHYIGLEEKGNLIGAALLLEKKMPLNKSYFYCPRGFVIDFNEKVLLEKMTLEVKNYCKSKGGIFLKIDPPIKRHSLDLDGNIIDGENNYELMDYLKKIGYNHTGFNTEFVNEPPRFTFNLNLEKDFNDIRKNMHSSTRNICNKGNFNDLNNYIGDVSDIPAFYETMLDTYDRNNLAHTKINYYMDFYSILNKHGMSDIYVSKVNIDKLRKKYAETVDQVNQEIKALETKENKNPEKTKNKIKDLNSTITKIEKESILLDGIENNEEVLSSMITVKYASKVWTVHGGNTTMLRHLNANYLIYYNIIEDAHKNGFKNVDFFGTSGNPNPPKDNPIFGIHNFKRRLGGEYIEYIGEFDFIINKPLYYAFKVLIPIRRKIINFKLRKDK